MDSNSVLDSGLWGADPSVVVTNESKDKCVTMVLDGRQDKGPAGYSGLRVVITNILLTKKDDSNCKFAPMLRCSNSISSQVERNRPLVNKNDPKDKPVPLMENEKQSGISVRTINEYIGQDEKSCHFIDMSGFADKLVPSIQIKNTPSICSMFPPK